LPVSQKLRPMLCGVSPSVLKTPVILNFDSFSHFINPDQQIRIYNFNMFPKPPTYPLVIGLYITPL